MAFPNRKKEASAIVEEMPSPDKLGDALEATVDEDAEGQDAAKASAFGDMRAAIKNGDDVAGAAAFEEFLSLCGYSKTE